MERQARLAVAQPERRIPAEDVNAMAARGQPLPELGRDDAAAADGGVADDADVHASLDSVVRRTGSRTTKPSAQRTPARAPNCASRLSISWRKSGVLRRVGAAPAALRVNWLVWQ